MNQGDFSLDFRNSFVTTLPTSAITTANSIDKISGTIALTKDVPPMVTESRAITTIAGASKSSSGLMYHGVKMTEINIARRVLANALKRNTPVKR